MEAYDYLSCELSKPRYSLLLEEDVLMPEEIYKEEQARKALGYAEQALRIVKKVLEEKVSELLQALERRLGKSRERSSSSAPSSTARERVLTCSDPRPPASRKRSLELGRELGSFLSRLFSYRKSFDVHVLDVKSFERNLEAGTFVSGLSLGYKLIHDELSISKPCLGVLRS